MITILSLAIVATRGKSILLILSLFLVANRGGTCSKIVQSKFCSEDLHYNQTFIAEKDQSNESILKSILKTNCSRDFEKYLCYTNVPPCKPNDLSVFVPCSDICEQVGP